MFDIDCTVPTALKQTASAGARQNHLDKPHTEHRNTRNGRNNHANLLSSVMIMTTLHNYFGQWCLHGCLL